MNQWVAPEIERDFPLLSRNNSLKTSCDTETYNCLAWAARDSNRWWEPSHDGVFDPGQYWPKGAPRNYEFSSLVKAYELHGFEVCRRQDLALGFDIIVLYEDELGRMSHAARWLYEDECWTSKLGPFEDISHDYLSTLEGDTAYGTARVMMRRYHP